MNTSEQVTRLTAITNAAACGHLDRAMRTLGFMSPAERGQMAKAAGCTTGQVELWMAGRWQPPVDQTLVLLGLALDRFRRSAGVEMANGAA